MVVGERKKHKRRRKKLCRKIYEKGWNKFAKKVATVIAAYLTIELDVEEGYHYDTVKARIKLNGQTIAADTVEVNHYD